MQFKDVVYKDWLPLNNILLFFKKLTIYITGVMYDERSVLLMLYGRFEFNIVLDLNRPFFIA